MERRIAQHVKGLFEGETAEAILKSSPSVLLGVDAAAAAVLEGFGIRTVFDLASSHVFASAYALSRETLGESSVFDHVGAVPGDVIDDSLIGADADTIARSDISVLRAIGDGNRDQLADALGAETVRDLGRWPAYHAARQILSVAYGGTNLETRDPDAPDELVPVARKYATESFRFQRVFIDRVDDAPALERRDLGTSPPVSLRQLSLDGSRRWSPATGALLTFEQTWKPQGLSLGQLLSSVALAPGESTKIAVIDWSRRVATAATEDIAERDRIQAQVAQTRAISEIQNVTARESSRGRSKQTTESTTDAGGYASGGGIGGLLGGGSGNESWADVSGETITVASSRGQRSVSADLMQEIEANTRQASTAVRSRRAALVTETTSTESEEIRTRVLTNYNHSHALTIQYYETVQIYRTELRLRDTQRVLFIPIGVIDFSDPKMISRFKTALLGAVTEPAVRDSISAAVNEVTLQEVQPFDAQAESYELDGNLAVRIVAARTSAGAGDDVKIIIERRSGDPVEVEVDRWQPHRLEEPVLVSEIERIRLEYRTIRSDLVQSADLLVMVTPTESLLNGQNLMFRSALSSNSAANAPDTTTQTMVSAARKEIDPNAIDYLNEHAVELSHAIWASLTQHELATILGEYEYLGEPLLEVVDIEPLTFFGNYLVMPYHPADDEGDEAWQAWRERHVLSATAREDLIPVPTDGLFGEAVLGRFNASEKIDMTRFWDWQESPIPMQAPDIGPIVAGNHVAGAPAVPGQLGPSIASLPAAQALPAPTGLAPIIAAAQADLFRDMSGLQQTAETLRSTIAESGDASETAAKLANELESIKQKTIGKLAEMAAQAGLAAAGAPVAAGGMLGGGGSSSGAGGGRSSSGVAGGVVGGMASGPVSRMSNTTKGGLLNESAKIDGQLLSSSGSTTPVSGAEGSQLAETMDSIRGYRDGVSGQSEATPAFPLEDRPNRLSLEERQDSLAAPFLLEEFQVVGNHHGGVPMLAWVVYDFGVGNTDPGVNGNAKGPLGIHQELKDRYQELVDQDIWVELQVFGFSDSSGTDEINAGIRRSRAQAASAWFVPTIDDRRANWVLKTDSDVVIPTPINTTVVDGAPVDRYLGDNDTISGRAMNRSVLIVEVAMHSVEPPGDVWLTGDEEESKFAEIESAIDGLRQSTDRSDRFKVLAFDLWQRPSSDLRVFTDDDVREAIADNTSSDEPEFNGWPFDPARSKDPTRYLTDYRTELSSALRDARKSPADVLRMLENVFRTAFGGIEVMNRDLDRVSGITNNANYISVRIRDWIIGQQQKRNTVYSAAFEFGDPE
jgi:hypothetical protein